MERTLRHLQSVPTSEGGTVESLDTTPPPHGGDTVSLDDVSGCRELLTDWTPQEVARHFDAAKHKKLLHGIVRVSGADLLCFLNEAPSDTNVALANGREEFEPAFYAAFRAALDLLSARLAGRAGFDLDAQKKSKKVTHGKELSRAVKSLLWGVVGDGTAGELASFFRRVRERISSVVPSEGDIEGAEELRQLQIHADLIRLAVVPERALSAPSKVITTLRRALQAVSRLTAASTAQGGQRSTADSSNVEGALRAAINAINALCPLVGEMRDMNSGSAAGLRLGDVCAEMMPTLADVLRGRLQDGHSRAAIAALLCKLSWHEDNKVALTADDIVLHRLLSWLCDESIFLRFQKESHLAALRKDCATCFWNLSKKRENCRLLCKSDIFAKLCDRLRNEHEDEKVVRHLIGCVQNIAGTPDCIADLSRHVHGSNFLGMLYGLLGQSLRSNLHQRVMSTFASLAYLCVRTRRGATSADLRTGLERFLERACGSPAALEDFSVEAFEAEIDAGRIPGSNRQLELQGALYEFTRFLWSLLRLKICGKQSYKALARHTMRLDVVAASAGVYYPNVPRATLRDDEISDLLHIVTEPLPGRPGDSLEAIRLFAAWSLAHFSAREEDQAAICAQGGIESLSAALMCEDGVLSRAQALLGSCQLRKGPRSLQRVDSDVLGGSVDDALEAVLCVKLLARTIANLTGHPVCARVATQGALLEALAGLYAFAAEESFLRFEDLVSSGRPDSFSGPQRSLVALCAEGGAKEYLVEDGNLWREIVDHRVVTRTAPLGDAQESDLDRHLYSAANPEEQHHFKVRVPGMRSEDKTERYQLPAADLDRESRAGARKGRSPASRLQPRYRVETGLLPHQISLSDEIAEALSNLSQHLEVLYRFPSCGVMRPFLRLASGGFIETRHALEAITRLHTAEDSSVHGSLDDLWPVLVEALGRVRSAHDRDGTAGSEAFRTAVVAARILNTVSISCVEHSTSGGKVGSVEPCAFLDDGGKQAVDAVVQLPYLIWEEAEGARAADPATALVRQQLLYFVFRFAASFVLALRHWQSSRDLGADEVRALVARAEHISLICHEGLRRISSHLEARTQRNLSRVPAQRDLYSASSTAEEAGDADHGADVRDRILGDQLLKLHVSPRDESVRPLDDALGCGDGGHLQLFSTTLELVRFFQDVTKKHPSSVSRSDTLKNACVAELPELSLSIMRAAPPDRLLHLVVHLLATFFTGSSFEVEDTTVEEMLSFMPLVLGHEQLELRRDCLALILQIADAADSIISRANMLFAPLVPGIIDCLSSPNDALRLQAARLLQVLCRDSNARSMLVFPDQGDYDIRRRSASGALPPLLRMLWLDLKLSKRRGHLKTSDIAADVLVKLVSNNTKAREAFRLHGGIAAVVKASRIGPPAGNIRRSLAALLREMSNTPEHREHLKSAKGLLTLLHLQRSADATQRHHAEVALLNFGGNALSIHLELLRATGRVLKNLVLPPSSDAAAQQDDRGFQDEAREAVDERTVGLQLLRPVHDEQSIEAAQGLAEEAGFRRGALDILNSGLLPYLLMLLRVRSTTIQGAVVRCLEAIIKHYFVGCTDPKKDQVSIDPVMWKKLRSNIALHMLALACPIRDRAAMVLQRCFRRRMKQGSIGFGRPRSVEDQPLRSKVYGARATSFEARASILSRGRSSSAPNQASTATARGRTPLSNNESREGRSDRSLPLPLVALTVGEDRDDIALRAVGCLQMLCQDSPQCVEVLLSHGVLSILLRLLMGPESSALLPEAVQYGHRTGTNADKSLLLQQRGIAVLGEIALERQLGGEAIRGQSQYVDNLDDLDQMLVFLSVFHWDDTIKESAAKVLRRRNKRAVLPLPATWTIKEIVLWLNCAGLAFLEPGFKMLMDICNERGAHRAGDTKRRVQKAAEDLQMQHHQYVAHGRMSVVPSPHARSSMLRRSHWGQLTIESPKGTDRPDQQALNLPPKRLSDFRESAFFSARPAARVDIRRSASGPDLFQLVTFMKNQKRLDAPTNTIDAATLLFNMTPDMLQEKPFHAAERECGIYCRALRRLKSLVDAIEIDRSAMDRSSRGRGQKQYVQLPDSRHRARLIAEAENYLAAEGVVILDSSSYDASYWSWDAVQIAELGKVRTARLRPLEESSDSIPREGQPKIHGLPLHIALSEDSHARISDESSGPKLAKRNAAYRALKSHASSIHESTIALPADAAVDQRKLQHLRTLGDPFARFRIEILEGSTKEVLLVEEVSRILQEPQNKSLGLNFDILGSSAALGAFQGVARPDGSAESFGTEAVEALDRTESPPRRVILEISSSRSERDGVDPPGHISTTRSVISDSVGMTHIFVLDMVDLTNQQDPVDGQTALMRAVINDDMALVKSLLSRGVRDDLQDSEGRTALMHGVILKRRELVFVLLDHHAEQVRRVQDLPFHRTAHVTLRQGILNRKDAVGNAAVHYAVSDVEERLDMVGDLLKAKIDVNVRDSQGRTALHLACSYGHVDTVKLLLNNNANVTLAALDGTTALHVAARELQIRLVDIILEQAHATSLVNAEDKLGRTALHFAMKKRVEDTEGSSRLQATLNAAEDEGGRSVEDASALRDNEEAVVQALLQAGADLNNLDDDGLPPVNFREYYRESRAEIRGRVHKLHSARKLFVQIYFCELPKLYARTVLHKVVFRGYRERVRNEMDSQLLAIQQGRRELSRSSEYAKEARALFNSARIQAAVDSEWSASRRSMSFWHFLWTMLYVATLSLALIYATAQFQPIGFNITSGLRTALLHGRTESDGGGDQALKPESRFPFGEVRNASTFWEWAKTTLVDVAFETEEADGSVRFVKQFMVQLAPIRLTQWRTEPGGCSLPSDFASIKDTCFPNYSPCLGQGTCRGAGNATAFAGSENTSAAFSPAEDVLEQQISGQFLHYGVDGYTVLFPDERRSALELLRALQRDAWVDDGTRAVLVDGSFFSGSAGKFTHFRFLMEFPPTGGAVPSAYTHTWNAATLWPSFRFLGQSRHDSAQAESWGTAQTRVTFAVLAPLLLLVDIFIELQECWRSPWHYLLTYFKVVDVLLIILQVTSAILSLQQYLYESSLDLDGALTWAATFQQMTDSAVEGGGYGVLPWETARAAFLSLQTLSDMEDSSRRISALAIILCFAKLLKATSYIYEEFYLLVHSVGLMIYHVLTGFVILILVVFTGAAICLYSLLGQTTEYTKTLSATMIYISEFTIGETDFERVQNEPSFNLSHTLCLYGVMVFLHVIMMTLLVSMLSDLYQRVKVESKRSWCHHQAYVLFLADEWERRRQTRELVRDRSAPAMAPWTRRDTVAGGESSSVFRPALGFKVQQRAAELEADLAADRSAVGAGRGERLEKLDISYVRRVERWLQESDVSPEDPPKEEVVFLAKAICSSRWQRKMRLIRHGLLPALERLMIRGAALLSGSPDGGGGGAGGFRNQPLPRGVAIAAAEEDSWQVIFSHITLGTFGLVSLPGGLDALPLLLAFAEERDRRGQGGQLRASDVEEILGAARKVSGMEEALIDSSFAAVRDALLDGWDASLLLAACASMLKNVFIPKILQLSAPYWSDRASHADGRVSFMWSPGSARMRSGSRGGYSQKQIASELDANLLLLHHGLALGSAAIPAGRKENLLLKEVFRTQSGSVPEASCFSCLFALASADPLARAGSRARDLPRARGLSLQHGAPYVVARRAAELLQSFFVDRVTCIMTAPHAHPLAGRSPASAQRRAAQLILSMCQDRQDAVDHPEKARSLGKIFSANLRALEAVLQQTAPRLPSVVLQADSDHRQTMLVLVLSIFRSVLSRARPQIVSQDDAELGSARRPSIAQKQEVPALEVLAEDARALTNLLMRVVSWQVLRRKGLCASQSDSPSLAARATVTLARASIRRRLNSVVPHAGPAAPRSEGMSSQATDAINMKLLKTESMRIGDGTMDRARTRLRMGPSRSSSADDTEERATLDGAARRSVHGGASRSEAREAGIEAVITTEVFDILHMLLDEADGAGALPDGPAAALPKLGGKARSSTDAVAREADGRFCDVVRRELQQGENAELLRRLAQGEPIDEIAIQDDDGPSCLATLTPSRSTAPPLRRPSPQPSAPAPRKIPFVAAAPYEKLFARGPAARQRRWFARAGTQPSTVNVHVRPARLPPAGSDEEEGKREEEHKAPLRPNANAWVAAGAAK